MYIIGQEEIDAMARVVNTKALFRYGLGHECERFETRYAAYLGAKHFSLAASGSYALTAAMIGSGSALATKCWSLRIPTWPRPRPCSRRAPFR
jgi:dTDP-4-amino-4,6-dideoxygalactose transaminase